MFVKKDDVNKYKEDFKFTIFAVKAIIFCLIFVTTVKLLIHTKEVPVYKTQVMYDLNDNFSRQKVRDYLVEMHVKYPDVAVAQMELESAGGTSNIAMQNNNIFGMKLATQRPTTALGERNNHAYYSHWRQSCIDYAMWQSFVMNPENILSEESWIDYIGRMYSKDDNYKIKLLRIKNGGDTINKRKL